MSEPKPSESPEEAVRKYAEAIVKYFYTYETIDAKDIPKHVDILTFRLCGALDDCDYKRDQMDRVLQTVTDNFLSEDIRIRPTVVDRTALRRYRDGCVADLTRLSADNMPASIETYAEEFTKLMIKFMHEQLGSENTMLLDETVVRMKGELKGLIKNNGDYVDKGILDKQITDITRDAILSIITTVSEEIADIHEAEDILAQGRLLQARSKKGLLEPHITKLVEALFSQRNSDGPAEPDGGVESNKITDLLKRKILSALSRLGTGHEKLSEIAEELATTLPLADNRAHATGPGYRNKLDRIIIDLSGKDDEFDVLCKKCSLPKITLALKNAMVEASREFYREPPRRGG